MIEWFLAIPEWVLWLTPIWVIVYNIVGLLTLLYLAYKGVIFAAPDICGTVAFWWYVALWPVLLPYGVICILV